MEVTLASGRGRLHPRTSSFHFPLREGRYAAPAISVPQVSWSAKRDANTAGTEVVIFESRNISNTVTTKPIQH